MSHFLKHFIGSISFTPIDPLGDGLREEIVAEQSEPDHIVLDERPGEEDLAAYLESITADIQNEADKLTFSQD
jgi:hypothetical protein